MSGSFSFCLLGFKPVQHSGVSQKRNGTLISIGYFLKNTKNELTKKGNCKINIEMQNTYQSDWADRSLFYNCRMFTEGFKKGQEYGELPPCIHVGILDFNQMKSPGYYHKICLMDEKTSELYSRKMEFHVIELKKLGQAKGKAKKLIQKQQKKKFMIKYK